jgi:hypothetical protein
MKHRAVLAQVALAALVIGLSSFSRLASHRVGTGHAAASLALDGQSKDGQRQPLSDEETTPAIARRAKEILDANQGAPLGTEVPFEIDGHSYVGRIEEHYHEPGGARRPWGRHRGVTVYRAE